ncbi:MAG: AraC family transcriptional regulator [Lysobacterales bacterium]
MNIDPLDVLLENFRISAEIFHTGPLCGDTEAQVAAGSGHMHVIRRGWVDVRHETLPSLFIAEPTLLFYPRPLPHRFLTDANIGADLICATVTFRPGRLNLLLQGLPPMLAVPLAEMPALGGAVELLLSEASENRPGRKTTVGRLFEVLVTLVLRKILNDGTMSSGTLAALSHPQLGKALTALHHAPEQSWTLDKLAGIAGMSRSRFAQSFKTALGTTVGDHLASYRLAVAQDLLRSATPLKHVASKVGYGSAIALSRAFQSRMGLTPRAWLRAEGVAAEDTLDLQTTQC